MAPATVVNGSMAEAHPPLVAELNSLIAGSLISEQHACKESQFLVLGRVHGIPSDCGTQPGS